MIRTAFMSLIEAAAAVGTVVILAALLCLALRRSSAIFDREQISWISDAGELQKSRTIPQSLADNPPAPICPWCGRPMDGHSCTCNGTDQFAH